MSTETGICRALLEIIAAARVRTSDLPMKLLALPSVQTTRSGLDIRKYNDAAVEIYIEADLKGNRNICWWLEFAAGPDDRWQIESSVYESHGETLHRFPNMLADDLAKLAGLTQQAAQGLVTSIDNIPAVRRALRNER